MNLKIIALCILLMSPVIPLQVTASPSSSDVKKELAKLKGKKKPKSSGSSSFGQFLNWLSNPIVLIIIISILGGLIFLALRNVSPYYRKEYSQKAKNAKGKVGKTKLSSVEAIYKEAMLLAKEGKLNEATQWIHKAAFEDLKNKQILRRHTEYTNNDVKRLIQSKDIYQPFCSIALWAEIASFSEKDVGREDFTRITQSFEHAFLGQ